MGDDVPAILDRTDPFDVLTDEPALGAKTVAELAAIDGAEAQLVAIAGDAAAPPARRYAAAEALLEGTLAEWRTSPDSVRAVADALAVALRDDLMHNRWGLPGHYAGRLGKELAALPSGVEEALAPLLDDDAPLIIDGSEGPAISQLAGYRIADLAAYLISMHRGSAWDAPEDVAARDGFIASLR